MHQQDVELWMLDVGAVVVVVVVAGGGGVVGGGVGGSNHQSGFCRILTIAGLKFTTIATYHPNNRSACHNAV